MILRKNKAIVEKEPNKSNKKYELIKNLEINSYYQ